VAGQTVPDAQLGMEMEPAFAPVDLCNDTQLLAARAVPEESFEMI